MMWNLAIESHSLNSMLCQECHRETWAMDVQKPSCEISYLQCLVYMLLKQANGDFLSVLQTLLAYLKGP